jgi:hypothetical protein
MSITSIPQKILSHIGTFAEPKGVIHLSETCTTMQKVFDTHEFWKNLAMRECPRIQDRFQEFTPDLQKFLFKSFLLPAEALGDDTIFKSKFSEWAKEKLPVKKLALEDLLQDIDRELQELSGVDFVRDPEGHLHQENLEGRLEQARMHKKNEEQQLLQMDPEHALAAQAFNDADQILGLLKQELEKKGISIQEMSRKIVDSEERKKILDGFRYSLDSSYKTVGEIINQSNPKRSLSDEFAIFIVLNNLYPEEGHSILGGIDQSLSTVSDQMYKVLRAANCYELLEIERKEKEDQRKTISNKLNELTEDNLIDELKFNIITL